MYGMNMIDEYGTQYYLSYNFSQEFLGPQDQIGFNPLQTDNLILHGLEVVILDLFCYSLFVHNLLWMLFYQT